MKKLTTTSSNDIVSANMPPETTPGANRGNVTHIKINARKNINSAITKTSSGITIEI